MSETRCPHCKSTNSAPTEGNGVGNTMDCLDCGTDFTPRPAVASAAGMTEETFFTAFTSEPCNICGRKRNWQLDGQLQAVCYDCGHPRSPGSDTALLREAFERIEMTLDHDWHDGDVRGPSLYEQARKIAKDHAEVLAIVRKARAALTGSPHV